MGLVDRPVQGRHSCFLDQRPSVRLPYNRFHCQVLRPLMQPPAASPPNLGSARVILFDIDGTLIRTGGAGVRAFAQTAATVFQRPGGTESLTFHGRTDSSLVREFLRVNGLPDHPENRERFLTSYLFLLDHQLQQHAGGLCPGVTRLLAELPTLPSPPLIGLLTGNVRLGAILKLNAHSSFRGTASNYWSGNVAFYWSDQMSDF